MSIGVNPNYTNLKAVVDSFNATYAAQGVEAEVKVGAGSNLVVTVHGSGGSVEIPISVPELDGATGVGDTAAMSKLMEKLIAAADQADGVSTALVSSVAPALKRSSVFCDMFQIMALLIEVAQQQRQTASKIRQMTHQAMQASYQSQAENIKTAMDTAFNLGLASAITSTVTFSASVVMTGVSIGKSVNGMDKSGLKAADKKIDQVRAEQKHVNDLKAASTKDLGEIAADKAAKGVISEKSSKLIEVTSEKKAQVDRCAQDLKNADIGADALDAPEIAVDRAQARLDRANTELKTAQALHPNEPNNPDVKAAQTKVDEAKALVKTAQDYKTGKAEYTANCERLLDSLDADVATVKAEQAAVKTKAEAELQKAKDDVTSAQADVKTAQAEVKKAEGDLKTAKNEVAKTDAALKKAEGFLEEAKKTGGDLAVAEEEVKTLKNAKADQEKNVQAAETKVTAAKKNVEEAEKKVKTAEGNVKTAEDKVKAADNKIKEAEAFRDQVLADSQFLSGVKDSMNNKLEAARHELQEAARLYESCPDAISARKWANLSQSMTQCGELSKQWFELYSEKTRKTAEYENKKIDVEQEGIRAQQESINELFGQSQELIDAVRKLLQELIQVENESNRMAIQA